MVDYAGKMEKRLQRLEAKYSAAPVFHYPGRGFIYVFGFTSLGKPVCLGPYSPDPDGESQANACLADLDDGELFELDTRDQGKAARVIKARLIARGKEPDEVLRKMLHQRGYEREKNR